jgi:CDP-diacylglycerol--glycerol-3-phosphate 3-phosphatidyltransferase
VNEQTKRRLRVIFQPVVALLLKLKTPPNAVTIFGLVLSVAAGFMLSQGSFLVAVVLLLLAGLADTVDGELARQSHRTHRMGAFLDSSFDRLAEFSVFFGMFWFYRHSPGRAALIFATLFASVAVSYVRARAEGIGVECRIGLFERPIRFLFTILGLAVGAFVPAALVVALWIILLGATFTVIQRIVYVIRRA